MKIKDSAANKPDTNNSCYRLDFPGDFEEFHFYFSDAPKMFFLFRRRNHRIFIPWLYKDKTWNGIQCVFCI